LTREENGIETLDKAEGLLRELEALYTENGKKDDNMKPKSVTYLAVLNTAARCGAGMEGARRAEALLLELQTLSEHDADYRITEPCWTACLTAFARVEPEFAAEGAAKVDEVLEKMENDDSMRRASVHVYTAAINAKVNDSDPRSVEEAAVILRQLKKPDSIAYKCVIKAFARIGYAAKADKLLWELQDLSAVGNPRLDPPDVVTIAACINAWAKGHVADTELALDRSRLLLDLIIDAYRKGTVQHYHQNVESWIFDEAIRLWSISRRSDAGEEAERLIATMYELHEKRGLFSPSFHTYVLALDAWSSSGRRDAGTRAIKLLETMENLHADGSLQEAINVRALSTALISVTRSGGSKASNVAQSLFERIVRLYKEGDRSATINARTVTSILACIIRSGDKHAPAQAIELLKKIKDLSDNGMASLRPNTIVFNCVLNGLAQTGMAEEAEGILEEMKALSKEGYPCAPDVVTISCVCRAFANSRIPGTGPRAENYLREARERYEGGDTQMKPDTRLYNSVITAFVNDAHSNPEAAGRADDLLHEMQLSAAGDNLVVPDLVSFSSVCQAYAKSSDPDGLEKAEKVFDRAEQLALEGSMEFPDIIFFSSVVLAFSRSKSDDATKKAEGLVHYMEGLSQKGRDIKPTTQVYNTLLSSYATSREPDRVEKAKALFAKMKDLRDNGDRDAAPDVSSHNWVILAAARSPSSLEGDRREHFNLALEYFRGLHDPENESKPNSFTYSYFLKACRMLLPEGNARQKLVGKAFELGQQSGLVLRDVLLEAFLADPELALRALEEAGVKVDNDIVPFIPDKWCVNVPRRKRFTNIDLQRWQR
jgi:pentatricopeptide repeat protein